MLKRPLRHRSSVLHPAVAYEPLDREVVSRAVDGGLLISRSAVTMAVKNHVIVAALRDNQNFDRVVVETMVRDELQNLALEEASYADNMRREIATITAPRARTGKKADRSALFHQLTLRRVTYSALASALSLAHTIDGFVDGIVEAARDDAWSDVGRAVEARLDRLAAPLFDPDYDDDKAPRLELLAADLRHLVDV